MSTLVMCTEYVTKVVHINQKLEKYVRITHSNRDIHQVFIIFYALLLLSSMALSAHRNSYVLTAINKNTLTISGHVFLFSTNL